MSNNAVSVLSGCGFSLLALICFVLDWRHCERWHYRGRSSSLWVLPALAFMSLAYLCFREVFHWK